MPLQKYLLRQCFFLRHRVIKFSTSRDRRVRRDSGACPAIVRIERNGNAIFCSRSLHPADEGHRIALVIPPFRQTTFFRYAAALRRTLQLRVETVGTSNTVRFCSCPRRVLVSIDRTQGTIFHSATSGSLPVRPPWTLQWSGWWRLRKDGSQAWARRSRCYYCACCVRLICLNTIA